ncbi:hypothetical protein FOR96_28410, partial [Bacillus anthracis]|nr:hypothetical protein [Bacillus anthracis]
TGILTFKTHKVKEVNLFASPNTDNPDIQKFQYIMSDLLNGQKLDMHKKINRYFRGYTGSR